MFCARCGKEVKEGTAFCVFCGASLKDEGQAGGRQESVNQAVWQMPGQTEEPPGAAGPGIPGTGPVGAAGPGMSGAGFAGAAGPGVWGSAPGAESKKKGKGGIIAVIVAAAVLVMGAAGACALYFTGDAYQSRRNLKLAERYFNEEEYEDALNSYNAALRLDNALEEAYLRSAEIYVIWEEYDKAVKILNRGMKRVKEDEALSGKLSEVYGEAVDFFLKAGDYDRAAEYCGEASEAGVPATELYLQAADACVATGDYDRAMEILQSGIRGGEAESSFADKLTEIRKNVAGTYLLQNLEMKDTVLGPDTLESYNINLILKEDGSLRLNMDDIETSLSLDGTWEYGNEGLILITDGQREYATLEADVITLEEEGMSMSFRRSGDASAVSGSVVPTPEPPAVSGVVPTPEPSASSEPVRTPVSGEDRYPDAHGFADGYIGDIMHTCFFDYTVNGAYVCGQYGDYVPEAGNKLLVAEVTVKNTSRSSITMFDTDFQVQWTDTAEDAYDWPVTFYLNVGESLGDEMLPGEYDLAVNESRSGILIFEVPEEEKDFSISYLEYFDDDTTGDTFFVYFTAEAL